MRRAALAVLAVGLAACGSTAAPAATASDQQLKDAVTTYSNAYLGGDGASAFNLLSSRCQLSIGMQQISAQATAAHSVYGVLPISTINVDSESGSRATVSYTYAVTTLNQSHQPWVLQGGSWRYDNC